MPSSFPEPLQCTLGRNSSWSRSCPSLTVSGCTCTKAFWVSTFHSEKPQSAQHFFLLFCSPVLDSVCEPGGQLVLQGFDTELLQWDFFDKEEMESWHSSVVKRVRSSTPRFRGPSGTAQAKSRTSKLQSETFSQPLAKVAGILRASPWSKRAVLFQNSIIFPSLSCGVTLSKDFQAEAYQEQEKAIKLSQAKVFWDRTTKSAQGELGKSLKHVRCTRLVFLKGHSSKEWEVPGQLFCA